MRLKNTYIAFVGLALAVSPILAFAASDLTVSCAGVPASTSVMWTASSEGGVTPISYLWGNNSTSTVQVISVTPGTYNMTIQATDASSTVATSTCSATVAQPTSTSTDYQTQIQNLLNQIATLRAQIQLLLQQQIGYGNSTTTPPVTPPVGNQGMCLKLNRDLSRGESGEAVSALQQYLATDPTIFSSSSITGYFGNQTEDAVRNFQLKHGIVPGGVATGFFGPMTRGYIQGHCEGGEGNPNYTNSSNASTTYSIQGVQGSENEHGNGDRGNNGGEGGN